jgi:molybdopterin/thiamine biosynthesis adenylyltransferase
MTAGVVGLGGTGSAVFEQLVRLGVGSLIAIDDDTITATNVTRVYGSTVEDVGRPKVEVAAANANRIGLRTSVKTYGGRVTDRETARVLRSCDIVFGCTDDHAGRAILSRLAYWYLIPLIDVGVMISADNGLATGVDVRITTVLPGAPCLLCRHRIDPQRAREELLEPEERQRLADEGYAQGLGEADPSVVSYTSLAASFAVSEMLERLIGYGDTEATTELLVRLHDRRLSSIAGTSMPDHYCADRNTWGLGDVEPFLGQVWAS